MFSREKKEYPLEELGKYIGEEIEVHYLDQNESRIEKSAVLIFPPFGEFFYIGEGLHSYHVVYWDRFREVDNGKGKVKVRDGAVRLIRDEQGNIIYENPEIPFDEGEAKHHLTENSTS